MRQPKKPIIAKIRKEFLDYGLKESSAKVYAQHLNQFCEHYGLTPYTLLNLKLEDIEDKTERFIRSNRNTIAPKRLGVFYSTIKAWCHHKKLIKNRKLFREIEFDSASRKTRDVALPNKDFIRKLCDNADLREKLVVVFYGVYAVRPSLIGRLKIEDIYHKDITINQNGSVKLSNRVWIWVKREYEGNKGNIDFPIILTSETSQWLEDYLNQRVRNGEILTPKTALIDVHSKANVDRIVKKLFDAVGFHGRKYLLRHLGSKLLKRAYENEDLKEWLCGHKGSIAAIYDHSGHTLAEWEIEDYKKQLHEKELFVYGLSKSQEDIIKAKVDMAKTIVPDVDESKIREIIRLLELGKMSFETFDKRLTEIIQNAMNKQIETRFEELFIKMNNKHNNQ